MKKIYTLYCLSVVFFLLFTTKTYSQRAEPFLFSCTTPGQDMEIDAIIRSAGANTFYHWQFKAANGNWTCLTEGVNNINGADFSVTGTLKNGGANDAPLLNIKSASAILENVMVRVVMANGADPCMITSPVFGGDDQAKNDTKYLRLHVFSNTSVCPPNAFSCTDNKLTDGADYYGGFENAVYNSVSEQYTRKNFGGNAASSDLIFGTAAGSYQDINNPFAMNNGFSRDIAPHSGNYQLVVRGSSSTTARAWYKNAIPVLPNAQYRFAVWVARIDDTDPIIQLKATAGATTTLLMSYDMFPEPIGTWKLVQGSYTIPAGVTSVSISINDGEDGGLNNYVLDDLCFRPCVNCATLPLHQFELKAYLQGNNANLKWIAENEMNTSSFMIERSTDGNNFNLIGTKLPSGPLNTPTPYQLDDNIQSLSNFNIIYYRIKAMDNDGRFAYSNVAIVKLGKTMEVQVWPSPFNDFVNITYNASTNTKLDISILNSLGKLIRKDTYSVNHGLNQLSVSGLETMSPGIYFIRVTDKNTNATSIEKISK